MALEKMTKGLLIKEVSDAVNSANDASDVEKVLSKYYSGLTKAVGIKNPPLRRQMVHYAKVILQFLTTRNIPHLTENRIEGWITKFNKGIDLCVSANTKDQLEGGAEAVKTTYNTFMPDLSIGGIVRSLQMVNPIMGTFMGMVGDKIAQIKDANNEMQNLLKDGESEDVKDAVNGEKQQKGNSQPRARNTARVTNRDMLEALQNTMLMNNNILQAILKLTDEVWGENNEGIKQLIAANDESLKQIKEQQDKERVARFQQIENDREAANDEIIPKDTPTTTSSEKEDEFIGNLAQGGFFQSIMGKVGAFLTSVSTVFISMGKSMGGLITKIPIVGGIIGKAGTLLNTIFGGLVAKAGPLVKGLFRFAKTIPGIGLILSIITGIADAFDDDEVRRITGSDAISGLDRVKAGIAGVFSWIGGIADWILGIFGLDTNLKGGIEQGVVKIVDFVVNGITGLFNSVVSFLQENPVFQTLVNIGTVITEGVMSSINFWVDQFKAIGEIDSMEDAGNFMINLMQSIWQRLKDTVSYMFEMLTAPLTNLKDNVAEFGTDAFDAIKSWWNDEDEVVATKPMQAEISKQYVSDIKKEKVEQAANEQKASINNVVQASNQTTVKNTNVTTKYVRDSQNSERSLNFAFSN